MLTMNKKLNGRIFLVSALTITIREYYATVEYCYIDDSITIFTP